MDEVQLQDAVDRYLRGEMPQEERSLFEELRKQNPEVDQLVVAHTFFLQEMERYAQIKEFKSTLHTVEAELIDEGALRNEHLSTGAKVRNMWVRYRRTIAVAACIGGIAAVCISGIMLAVSPKSDARTLELLSTKVNIANSKADLALEATRRVVAPKTAPKTGGTSFLIDGRGYLVTNAHVITGASSVIVADRKGDEYKVKVIFVNPMQDLAILKIDDSNWESPGVLPYGIKRSGTELGERIFTLGYPRNEVVYGEGYTSAKTGNDGDTSSYQITVSANPGNSGGPVLNDKGEVVGILRAKQEQEDGAVFALRSKSIYLALDSMRRDTSGNYPSIRVSSVSTIRTLDRVAQIKKIEDCVYMVKGY